MTSRTRDVSEYACSTCCNRSVPRQSHIPQRLLNTGSADVGEDDLRFWKALDEDVKIGVTLALAPPSAQNNGHVALAHGGELRVGED